MKLEYSVIINRPVEEVFAFVSDVENWPQWVSGTAETKQTTSGPVAVGTTFTQISHFLGRRFELNATVTEHEPNKRFAVESDGKPMPFGNRITFEVVGNGTKLTDTMSAVGDVGGLFKLAEPVLDRMFRRQFEKDHETLKDLLEARVGVGA